MPIVAETDLDSVVATIEAERPDACVIDSVQVLYDPALTGSAGSVGQVREVAGRLMRVAKERGTAVILVGHVTKEGVDRGPARARAPGGLRAQLRGRARALLPDAARAQEPLRLHERGRACSRCATAGLVEVEDASARFVAEATHAPGSVVLCAMEGSRPLLVEVQALVAPSELAPPRRVANGVDRNRLALILAVLARHGGVRLGGSDVFVSIAGGVRVEEPGADLAIALALASARAGARTEAPAAARRLRRARPDRASCARRPTPTGAWPRPRKFGLTKSSTPAPSLAALRRPCRAALRHSRLARPALAGEAYDRARCPTR